MTTPKTNKQTQKKQFQILVDFMTTHPDLAKGLMKTPNAKIRVDHLWKRVTSELNAAGPPMRDMAGWRKVWADYKLHLKAKMRRNRTNIAGTGGGPSVYSSLNELEQRVSELLSINKAVGGIGSTREFGARQTDVPTTSLGAFLNDSNLVDMPEGENDSDSVDVPEQVTEKPSCSRSVLTPRNKQSLLEKQVDNQIMYQKNSTEILTEINDSLKNISKTMERTYKMVYKIEKQKLKLAKEQFVHSRKMDCDNFKLKLSKLEIQKQMLELQTNKTHEKHGTSF
ncbi:uncharacterized protein LOC129251236 [Anastrepha obliqua]|uniref:uncharacterized protein LOC129251236 n=1 Tax=Anastrepha obliqua TaxID=95512 RepID=UPI002409459A|nr:uncharacterized protein LOC129251236 [Anastrepha obliqua]